MPIRRLAVVVAAALAVAGAAIAVGGGPAADRPAVATVRVWSDSGPPRLATGLVVGRGRVMTVDHVLGGARRIEVQGSDGVRRAGGVLERRPRLDIAVLRVPGATGPAVRFGGSGAGLRVLTAGDGAVRERPARLRRRIMARLVDQPGRPRRPSLELSVDISGGDSGAPVVDRDGAVVGIVYARSTRRDGRAYAVRADALR